MVKKTDKAEAMKCAVKQHLAVCQYLNGQAIYDKLIVDLGDSLESRILARLLKSREPIRNKDVAEEEIVSTGAVSDAAKRLRRFLNRFSPQLNPLHGRKVVLDIPLSFGGLHLGYYLACLNTEDSTYLDAPTITRLLFENYWEAEVENMLKKQVEDKARSHLVEKLESPDDYQPLEMEIGIVEEIACLTDGEKSEDTGDSEKHEHGRLWRPFDPKSLLKSKDVYILSSEAGTGKTTFMRHLQQEIIENDDRIPILLHASRIEKWDFTGVASFAFLLAEKLWPSLPAAELRRFLFDNFQKRILVLVDGLDQIGGVGTEYRHLLDKLLRICSDNLIVASRPTAIASQEINQKVKFLRVKPFTEQAQRKYFGEHYSRARQLCERDLNLMAVPMLACMVRTLVKKGKDKGIKNRASLYKRFIDYILKEYDHEESKINRDEQQTVRGLLREISYEALNSEKPMIQKIPLRFCWDFTHKYKNIEIDKLPKYGLVNLLVDRSEGIDDYIYFSHQSFQEYLAAEYIAQSHIRINEILAEKWNPKWKEVIKFLAGLAGHDIIEKILAEKDNPIHSKLFLSAELVPETDVTVTLRNKMSKEIEKLLYHQIFFVDAVECFLHVDKTRAIDKFINMLDDEDKEIVSGAIWAIGNLQGKVDIKIVEKIVGKLDDKDDQIVDRSIDALRKHTDQIDPRIVEKIASKLDDGDIGIATVALWTLEECCDKIDAKIVMKIASIPTYAPDQIVDSANQVLGKIHAKIVNEIANKLDDEDKGIVCSAINALGKLQDKVDIKIVEKIASKLEDEDVQIVKGAINALGNLEDKVDIRIVEQIVRKLDDKDKEIVRGSIWILGVFKNKIDFRIVEKIANKLNDKDKEIVRGAIWTLGECHDKLSLKIVRKIASKLDDGDRWTILQAIWSLGKLQGKINANVVMKIASKLYGNDEEICDEAVSVLIGCHNKVDVKTMKTIASKLDDEDSWIVSNAIGAIVALQDRFEVKIVEKIVRKIDDEDDHIVQSAIWALGNLQGIVDIRILEKIANKLDDENKGIVLQAIWALGYLRDKVDIRIVEKIVSKLDDENEKVVQEAIWALVELENKLDGEIVERIATKLDDENRYIVWSAMEAIKNLQDKVDIRIDEKIASKLDDEDSWIVQSAMFDLGDMRDKVDIRIVEKIASKLDDENEKVVQEAIWTLGKFQDKVDVRIVEKIASKLDDKDDLVVQRAISALEAFQDKLDAKILMKLILREKTYAYNVVKKMYQLGKLEFLNWEH